MDDEGAAPLRHDTALRQATAWWRWVDRTATVGLLLMCIEWGWQGTAFAAATVTICTATVVGSVWSGYDRCTGLRAGRCTLDIALVGIGMTGLVAALHVVGALLVLVLAATSPPVVARAARLLIAPPDPADLDDTALCLAWRRSFLRLREARSAGEALAIVEQRARYLDELHRRSPRGLTVWRASEAHP